MSDAARSNTGLSNTRLSNTGLSLWELMAVDPAVPMDRAALRLVISDQRRWSRTYVYPWLRIVSRVLVTMIACGKRACPVPFGRKSMSRTSSATSSPRRARVS